MIHIEVPWILISEFLVLTPTDNGNLMNCLILYTVLCCTASCIHDAALHIIMLRDQWVIGTVNDFQCFIKFNVSMLH